MDIINPSDNAILGTYFPGFFTIHVDTKAADFRNFTPRELATYLHEYVHYMQSVVTANGICRWVFLMDRLANVLSQMREGISTHELMAGYREMLYRDARKNRELAEFKEFGVVDDSVPHQYRKYPPDVEINLAQQRMIAHISYKIPKVGKNFTFDLNSTVILEGMAHVIEVHAFPSRENRAPYYPYKLMRHIATGILGRNVLDAELLSIADLSLQTSRAGYAFCDMCHQLRMGRKLETLWNEDIGFSSLDDDSEIHACNPVETCEFLIGSPSFNEALECVFSGDVRKTIDVFLREIFQRGAAYRRERGGRVFTDLLDINETNIFEKLGALHQRLGMPATFNSAETVFFGAFADNVLGAPYLPVLKVIADTIYSLRSVAPCPFRHVCAKPGFKYSEIYDPRVCPNNFLTDLTLNENQCLAKALAYSMGMAWLSWDENQKS